MPVFIALYRGVNVGGRNSVPMAALREMHERLGQQRVATYIQSGNVVFAARGAPAALARRLSAEFAAEFGFSSSALVVAGPQWRAMLADNPYRRFAAQDPKSVHAAICQGRPNEQALGELLAKTGGRETFAVGEGVIYLHTPDGLGRSKFAAGLEKAAAVPVTMRNWRTVAALDEMARAGD